MQGIVGFKDLSISCIIGDFPEERDNEQLIFIDLKVQTDISRCMHSDILKDTISYVDLAEICTNQACSQKYHLLEALANNILERIFADFPVSWAWIKVKKPKALPSALYAFVELEKKR
jgi:dihydroneopterin aldolase